MNTDVLFYLMMGVGALIFVAAISNWEWFFKQRRAQVMIKLMGRTGARVFYGLLGAFFSIFAWMVLSGRLVIDSIF
ncbi:immunity 17 family protein [Carboxylicivirga marina]|uniref:Immunity 17 family protein n=1 Tax=Carboxylicivirga marina TaxID=2800988 RepID=A0ABS1HQ50_9BACT|nr:immunity 17 family protein [Carboxylicivirga marina]MBK3519812.1 immunity 17 family protein [Carboxylicivirga marina]